MSHQTSKDDRRRDPRATAEHKVHLMVSLHGFDDEDRTVEANGITLNLSHRGALVRVNRPLEEGARCLVHLPDGDKRIGKTLIYGTVLRTKETHDIYDIAIQFDTRLQEIDDSVDDI